MASCRRSSFRSTVSNVLLPFPPEASHSVQDRRGEMQTSRILFILFVSLLIAYAQEAAGARGIVHDPQHRPLPGAQVTLRGSAFSRTAAADANGEFQMNGVPEGAYTVEVSAAGF